MLPRRLYEFLPYLYILTGIVSTSLIDSAIVLLSSMLLIMTGLFILYLRTNFRRYTDDDDKVNQPATEPLISDHHAPRSGFERRCRTVAAWPIMDYSGARIYSDRRTGERRTSS
jgi:hypothetical protein